MKFVMNPSFKQVYGEKANYFLTKTERAHSGERYGDISFIKPKTNNFFGID